MVQVNQTHVQTLIKVKFIIFSGFMDVCPSGNIDRQTIADIYAMPRRWSDISGSTSRPLIGLLIIILPSDWLILSSDPHNLYIIGMRRSL